MLYFYSTAGIFGVYSKKEKFLNFLFIIQRIISSIDFHSRWVASIAFDLLATSTFSYEYSEIRNFSARKRIFEFFRDGVMTNDRWISVVFTINCWDAISLHVIEDLLVYLNKKMFDFHRNTITNPESIYVMFKPLIGRNSFRNERLHHADRKDKFHKWWVVPWNFPSLFLCWGRESN